MLTLRERQKRFQRPFRAAVNRAGVELVAPNLNLIDIKQRKKDPTPNTVPPPAKDSPFMNRDEWVEMLRTAKVVSIEPNTTEARARINAEAQ